MDSLNERLSQVKVCKRADVNVLCDWVVTLPKDVQVDDEQKFLKLYLIFCRSGTEQRILSMLLCIRTKLLRICTVPLSL